MKRMYLACIGLLIAWLLFCASCMRFRMNDQKAVQLFTKHNSQLQIFDTVINDRPIHFAVTGNDSLPTLVFIHGSPGSWSNYATYMYDSSLQHKFRMVSIDRPGFGYSDFGNPMHLQEQSALFNKVVTMLSDGRPVYLAGHSIGGPVVAQMAALSPNDFRTIVIMSGSISPYLEKKEGWRNLLDNSLLRKFLPGAFAPSNTEIKWFKKDLYVLERQLSQVRSGVVFIHGDKDSWVPVGNVQYGIEKMTKAKSVETHILKGEGHFIPWKNFNEIRSVLLNLY